MSEASQIKKNAESQSTIGCFVLIFAIVVERHSNHSAKIAGSSGGVGKRFLYSSLVIGLGLQVGIRRNVTAVVSPALAWTCCWYRACAEFLELRPLSGKSGLELVGFCEEVGLVPKFQIAGEVSGPLG